MTISLFFFFKVVDKPKNIESCEAGLWLQFFKGEDKACTLQDQAYFALLQDVQELLSPPAATTSGSRMTFNFKLSWKTSHFDKYNQNFDIPLEKKV